LNGFRQLIGERVPVEFAVVARGSTHGRRWLGDGGATVDPDLSTADQTLARAEVREKLHEWSRRLRISYVSLFDPGEDHIQYFPEEVAAPLNDG
jgi:hypothetical protein